MLTFLGALGGVLLGWWLLSGKVHTLGAAVAKSDQLLADHNGLMERTLAGLREQLRAMSEQIAILNVQSASTTESLGQTRGDISDIAERLSEGAASEPQPANREPAHQTIDPDRFRQNWGIVRDTLETMAADPMIDGRTRARYGRIDRRNYHDLIDALSQDGRLPDDALFRQAVDIWYAHRNGRSPITAGNADRLTELAGLLNKRQNPALASS